METIDLSLIIDLAAIILAVAAMIITVIGFFASLRFYRDGVELQSKVRELLSRVDEKVASVQSQVGGMFAKTLDAVIGRTGVHEAAEAQRRIMIAEAGGEQAPSTLSVDAADRAEPVPETDDLPQRVVEYFAFKKLRYSDVTTADGRAVFLLGAGHGFQLFDGLPGIVFFGYFHDLEKRDIVARVRFLFDNIEASYKRIESGDEAQQRAAKALLDSINITVLVAETADRDEMIKAITEYQPQLHTVPVVLATPTELRDQVQSEYDRMGI